MSKKQIVNNEVENKQEEKTKLVSVGSAWNNAKSMRIKINEDLKEGEYLLMVENKFKDQQKANAPDFKIFRVVKVGWPLIRPIIFIGDIMEENYNIWILEDKQSTRHDFIKIVLAYWVETDQFVTWVFNTESGGFAFGHYFLNYDNAQEDFKRRD